jgi:hypothetical protein
LKKFDLAAGSLTSGVFALEYLIPLLQLHDGDSTFLPLEALSRLLPQSDRVKVQRTAERCSTDQAIVLHSKEQLLVLIASDDEDDWKCEVITQLSIRNIRDLCYHRSANSSRNRGELQ